MFAIKILRAIRPVEIVLECIWQNMLEGPPQFRERDEHDTRLDRDYFGFLQRF
jgi:hypothetical protein